MAAPTGLTREWTVSDLSTRFGPILHTRIRQNPAPGTATEQDVLDIYFREMRLYELVDGVLIEKASGTQESYLAGSLGWEMSSFVESRQLGFVLEPNGMIRIRPGTIRIPNFTFISWNQVPGRKVPRTSMLEFAPELAVEVLSPSNTEEEMATKLKEYFGAGCRQVWYVDAVRKTVKVFSAVDRSTLLRETDTLAGDPVLTGFSLPLAQLFEGLEE